MALVWLLDLDLGGRVLYASTRPTTFDSRRYVGTLDEVTLREELALGGAPAAREASIDLVPEVSAALLASYGHTFTRVRGTLRLWDSDEAEYLAEVALRDGRGEPPEYAAANEPLSLSLSAEPGDDVSILLPSTAKIDSDTWPDAPTDSSGQAYPIPFGTPGLVTGAATSEVPAAECFAVESNLGDSFLFLAVAATVDDEATIVAASSSLFTGMEVVYADNGGGGFGLTDGSTYYVRHESGNLYTFHTDEDVRNNSTPVALSGTPSGTESIEVTQPYATKYLVAGCTIAAANVSVRFQNLDGRILPASDYVVTNGVDALGQPVATIDSSNVGTGAGSKFPVQRRLSPVLVAYDNGGAYRSTGAGPVESVGDLLADLAFRSTVSMDVGTWLVVRDVLSSPVGLVLTADRPAADLLLDLVERLPVATLNGPNGLAAVPIASWGARPAAVELIDGRNAFRAGALSVVNEPSDAANRAIVTYGPSLETGTESGSVTVSSDPSDGSADVFSRTSTGLDEPVSEVVDVLDWTFASATARVVARWLIRQASATPRRLAVDVPSDLARSLRLGTAVEFTSDALSIDRRIGLVSSREMSTAPLWRLELYFLHGVADNPAETPSGASPSPPSTPTN